MTRISQKIGRLIVYWKGDEFVAVSIIPRNPSGRQTELLKKYLEE